MPISSEDYSAHIQNDIHQIECELQNIANLFYIIHKADTMRTITALYQYAGSVLKIIISPQKYVSNISEAITHIMTHYTVNKYCIA